MSFIQIEIFKSDTKVLDTSILPYTRAVWELRRLWNQYAEQHELEPCLDHSPVDVLEVILSYSDFRIAMRSIV